MTNRRLSIAGDRRAGAGGYSFTEVLFAVAVLGIGFIMIAAIYPVAIQQTQLSLEETVGAVVSRNGVGLLSGSSYMNAADLPETSPAGPAVPVTTPHHPGRVFGFRDVRIAPPTNATANVTNGNVLWDSVRANLISRNDPRYAFVPMYIRNRGSSFATLICIAVQNRNRNQFEPISTVSTGGRRAELEPQPVLIDLRDGGNNPDIAVITQFGTQPENQTHLAAVEGAYLIVSDDARPDDATTPFTNEYGRMNGRVYRLGPQITSDGTSATFQLSPGDDMASAAENVTSAGANGFIVGRGYTDPADATAGFSGPNMAIQQVQALIGLR